MQGRLCIELVKHIILTNFTKNIPAFTMEEEDNGKRGGREEGRWER